MKNEKILNLNPIMTQNKMRIKWDSKISGIYAWINEIDGKMYIGQTTNLYKRVYCEMNNLRNNKPQNLIKLERAVKKYGIENFRVIQLLECPREYLNKIEKLLIEYYDTKKNGYNCTYGGEGTFGHIVTEEQRKKQKENMRAYWTNDRKKQHAEKMKMWFYSKPKDDQNRMCAGNYWWLDKKYKEKQLENTRNSLTLERIEKQRKSIIKYYEKNKSKKLKCFSIINPAGDKVLVEGISKFCEKNKLSCCNIKKVLNGNKQHHKGWHIDPNFMFVSPTPKKLKSPDGKIYEFQSILKFCREYDLDLGGIKNVLKEKSKHHKLWRLPETSLEDAINNKNFVYKNTQFRFPDNHIERVLDRKRFCQKYGFSHKYLYKFIKNKPCGSMFHNLKLISK